jgi:general stress protein YciG
MTTRTRSATRNSRPPRDSEGRFTSGRRRNYPERQQDNYANYDRDEGSDYDVESEYDDYDQNYGEEEDNDYAFAGNGTRGNRRGGFASMDEDEHRRISSAGGRSRWDEDNGGRGYESNHRYRSGRISNYGESENEYDGRGGAGRGRGFAGMDEEEQREIASMGGRARWGYHGDRGYGSDEGSQGGSRGRATSRRGFASMDEEEQREIARRGGEAAHRYGNAHEWDSEEARQAGRLGGRARWNSRRGEDTRYSDDVRSERSRGGRGFASMDREEVRRIGRRGGEAPHRSRGRRSGY